MSNTKKQRKVGNATQKSATVAKKETVTEKVKKIRTNVFGAPSQRANRTVQGKSELGNRKWVFRAVTKVSAGGAIAYENTVPFLENKSEFVGFDSTEAAHAAAKAAKAKDATIQNARVYPRQGKYALWVAFERDNGKLPVTA